MCSLADHVARLGFEVYRGSEHDVLDRYHQVATSLGADIVVRITGDCPLIDPTIVDYVIERFVNEKPDYASNVDPPTFPERLKCGSVHGRGA